MLEFHAETSGSLTIEDLDASDLSRRNLWGDTVDQLLAQEHVNDVISELDGETLWALTDNLGSVRDMVDSDGNARVHRQFDSFGNLVDAAYYDAEGDPMFPGWFGYGVLAFGYTGRPLDETTDLQNNLNRWYEATTGRWMSEDPIGFAAGDANLYRYVGNEPTGWVDPRGLDKATPGDQRKIAECDKLHEKQKAAEARKKKAKAGSKEYCDALAEETYYRKQCYDKNCDYYWSLGPGKNEEAGKKGHLRRIKDNENEYKKNCGKKMPYTDPEKPPKTSAAPSTGKCLFA